MYSCEPSTEFSDLVAEQSDVSNHTDDCSKLLAEQYSYLHYLGFRHSDLFVLFEKHPEPLSLSISELLKRVTLTPERSSQILTRSATTNFPEYRKFLATSRARVVLSSSPEFPELLRQAPNRIFLIYVQWRLQPESFPFAIVGSREATSYGEQTVRSLVPNLVRRGFSIISGGALGIDKMVHEAAIDAGGHTVVVLGSSIDQWYPRTHTRFFEKVIESGGAIVSQFPLQTEPAPYTFPIRNEVIAAWSRGTLVIEAKERSGSLITAQIALDIGRDVFAIPSDIGKRNSRGCNRLIQSGAAKLILGPDDILEEYDMARDPEITRTAQAKNPEEAKILNLLAKNPVSIDDCTEQIGLPIGQVLVHLWQLEIRGMIARNVIGQYSLTDG